MILTLAYTPDIEEAWNLSADAPQEVVLTSSHSSFLLTLLFAFLSAAIAYFIPAKLTKNSRFK
jgi:hypothetical protein